MHGQRNGDVTSTRKTPSPQDQRSEVRYEVPIEIEVSGIDKNGKVYHVLTFTRDASEWGCAFLSPVELRVDDIVSLRVASRESGESVTERQSPFQVRGVTKEQSGWLVGAWKMDDADMWGLDLKKFAQRMAGGHESNPGGTAKPDERPRKDNTQ